MNNKMSDSQLNELFKNDALRCSPDPAVKSRLDYTFMLKEGQGKIRQNSFTEVFAWFFSVKNIPVAATFFMAVLLLSVLNSKEKPGNQNIPAADTASIQIMPLNIDSIIDQPLSDDTVVSLELSSLKSIFPDIYSSTLIQPIQITTICKLTMPVNEVSFEVRRSDFRKVNGLETILLRTIQMNQQKIRTA